MDEAPIETCKIVVHGPWGTGKTSFISTITEIDIISTEKDISKASKEPEVKENTTVAMDFGRITSADQTVILYLFAIPQTRHFRFDFLQDLAEGVLGFILMVDSRYPEMFRETHSLFQRLMVRTFAWINHNGS